jgi:acetyl esterase/lipase
LFYAPPTDQPVPLLVDLHTWNGGWQQGDSQPAFGRWCVEKGWALIHPHFRGANNNPQACGSELAVQDILSAVEYARRIAKIDPDRIYVVGVSGGGHKALLLAGRAPDLWAGVSAWCGISDLAAWHAQTKAANLPYWQDLESACGGAPESSEAADLQYRQRSPLTWLSAAATVPVDLAAGITDGFKGSVPVSHSLNAYNAIVAETARVPEAEILTLAASPTIAPELRQFIDDPLYRHNPVLYRRTFGNTRVTLFQGGHQIIYPAALEWLSRQRKGQPADFELTSGQSETPAAATDSGK